MALNPFIPQMLPGNLLCVRYLLGTLHTSSNFILTVAVEVDSFPTSQISKCEDADEVY